MNKGVLFIEDEFADFEYFSNILRGYNIYPQDDVVTDQPSMSNFLYGQTCNDYQQLKDNVFNYIIEKELYDDKLSFLILDITLLNKDERNKCDESGKKLLRDFRTDFYTHFKKIKGENEKYKNWSSNIWVIVLTNLGKDKCRQIEDEYGNPMCALNKDDIKADNQYLITKLNNMGNQKSNDKEYLTQPVVIKNINTGGGDYVEGNQTKTTGDDSPIIFGDNIVQSYNNLKNELTNKYQVTPKDADELGRIIKEEKQRPDNDSLISKMKNWWNKVKSYVRDLSVDILGSLLVSLYLLPPEQVLLIIQAIQK